MGKLPNQIREIRKKLGLTLEQLAEASRISVGYIGRIETGDRPLSSKHIHNIASALGVSASDLFSGSGRPGVPILGYVGLGEEVEYQGEDQHLGYIDIAGIVETEGLGALIARGDAGALNILGSMYLQGQGVSQDIPGGLRLIKLAADQGYPLAIVNLGFIYFSGEYVPQSDIEAAKWFEKAAKRGNVESESVLGFMYMNGRGVEQNDSTAVKWFQLAANQGAEKAQFYLGNMYRLGNGVPQDYVTAHMWFNLSSAQGNETAKWCRTEVEKLMSATQIERAQELARNWKPSQQP
eukprot:gene11873-11962_t